MSGSCCGGGSGVSGGSGINREITVSDRSRGLLFFSLPIFGHSRLSEFNVLVCVHKNAYFDSSYKPSIYMYLISTAISPDEYRTLFLTILKNVHYYIHLTS